LPNVLRATFIQGATSIPDFRVHMLFLLIKRLVSNV
jgi:hypothetical protein